MLCFASMSLQHFINRWISDQRLGSWCVQQQHNHPHHHHQHMSLSRRAVLCGAVLTVATRPLSVLAAEDQCPADDRCAVSVLLSSNSVPLHLREALKLASDLYSGWNDLTSDCNGDVCRISPKRVLEDYLNEQALLMLLATEGGLRDSAIVNLVPPENRQAYARNRERYESSMRYVAMSAALSKYDPALPTYAKDSYVPKGLRDDAGRLLGSSLENARDFLLDAKDALIVCCSFIHCASAKPM